MTTPARVALAATLLALLPSTAFAQRSPPPPGWRVIESPGICALDSGPLAVIRAAEAGGGNASQGVVATIGNWPPLDGDHEIRLRIPDADHWVVTRVRQTAPGEYYVMLPPGSGDFWFRQLGNQSWFELSPGAKDQFGATVTIRYTRDHMRQALAWLDGCRF